MDDRYNLKKQIKAAFASYDEIVLATKKQFSNRRSYDKRKIEKPFEYTKESKYIDTKKPGRLKLDELEETKPAAGYALLKYMSTFQEQTNQEEIDLPFIKSFVDAGVNVNSCDDYGQTMLHAAVRDWNPDVALFFIRNKAKVNVQDKYGRTPLHLAAALNYQDVAKTLLEHGADPNIVTFKEEQSPLHFAAMYNSVDTLKLLVKHGGEVTLFDHMNRSVAFIAAMHGSGEVLHFLLDAGVPLAVFDHEGNSALTYLLERVPQLAYQALWQYAEVTSRDQYVIYIGSLDPENQKAKTPLEVITAYNDRELIMHPVMQKCIEIKWKMFGRKDTLKSLFITFIYVVCWLVLAYTLTDTNEFYYDKTGNWDKQGWKIALESFIVIFAIYFTMRDVSLRKKLIRSHQNWVDWMKYLNKYRYLYCHPAWPCERETLKGEVGRIEMQPSLAGKQKFWLLYEWMILLFLAGVIVSRVFLMIFPASKTLLLIHKCILGVNMIFSFLRLLKIGIRFRYLAVFIKVARTCLVSIIQVGFLYLQIYIPFVAAFWVMFGVIDKTDSSENRSNHTSNATIFHAARSLNNIFFHLYGATFGQEDLYRFESTDSVAFHTITALYQVFATFITFSIIIAFVTARFKTSFNRCVADAALHQAYAVLQIEKNMGMENKKKLSKCYKRNCNPLVVKGKVSEEIKRRYKLKQLTYVESTARKLMELCRKGDIRIQRRYENESLLILNSIEENIKKTRKDFNKFGKVVKKKFDRYCYYQNIIKAFIPSS